VFCSESTVQYSSFFTDSINTDIVSTDASTVSKQLYQIYSIDTCQLSDIL